MTVTDAEPAFAGTKTLIARFRAVLNDSGEAAVTQRLAATIFVIRVISAGLAYVSQVLLARWMGDSEYGIYVYVWTWVLLLGSLLDFGIAISAQKFIPEYRGRGDAYLLRGFLSSSRWITLGSSSLVAAILAGAVWLASESLGPRWTHPLWLGCATLPAFVLANTQDGISRSHDWMRLALMPQFIVRQALLIGFVTASFALGAKLQADGAMLLSLAAVWIAMIGQMILLNRRLAIHVEAGPRAYDFRKWFAVSLPIVLVEGFYLLLTYSDILVLQYYRPSADVGIYNAVVKTLVLVSFIHYAIGATTAHRFSEYHAAGDRERLAAYLAYAIKWTFWPSMAMTVLLLICGKPMLWLFGPSFVDGYGIMFVLAIGLVARSAIGPVEKLLNMTGQQNICAMAYATAFALNLTLCFLLIPHYGGYGAAASTSASLVFESVLLFWITRYRLGYRVFGLGKP